MNSTVSWECLSVAEFLHGSNWQGLPPQPEKSATNLEPEALKNWQTLSTKEFFSLSNWEGTSSSISSSDRLPKVFSLTLPVAEFFQCFGWYGNPTAYSSLEIKPAIETEDKTTTKQITVNQLSQLF